MRDKATFALFRLVGASAVRRHTKSNLIPITDWFNEFLEKRIPPIFATGAFAVYINIRSPPLQENRVSGYAPELVNLGPHWTALEVSKLLSRPSGSLTLFAQSNLLGAFRGWAT